jgi:hypothetical protein
MTMERPTLNTLPRFGRFRFEALRDVAPDGPNRHLIRGILNSQELSVLYGPSGSGKTFIALDIAAHIASGRPWCGKEVAQGAVVYLATEGGTGTIDRLIALREAFGDDIPIFYWRGEFNFLNGTDVYDLLDDLDCLAGNIADPIRMVIFDTLSQAIPGGNENASEDMTSVIHAAGSIQRGQGCAVMLVHHSAKSSPANARGHSSLLCAVDTAIEVSNGEIAVRKQRNLDAGKNIGFTLEKVEVAFPGHAQTIESCRVQWGNGRSEKDRDQHTKDSSAALSVLETISGADAGIPVDQWRNACMDTPYFAAKPSEDARRKAFNRGRSKLETMRLVELDRDMVVLSADRTSLDNVPTCPPGHWTGQTRTHPFRGVRCPGCPKV